MSGRDTRLALARPSLRRWLWTGWIGGALVWSAIVDAPAGLHALLGWSRIVLATFYGLIALAGGLAGARYAPPLITALMVAVSPLAAVGLRPTAVVVSVAWAVAAATGGCIIGSATTRAARDCGHSLRSAAAGLVLAAASGGIVLVALSPLWLCTAVVLAALISAATPSAATTPSAASGASALPPVEPAANRLGFRARNAAGSEGEGVEVALEGLEAVGLSFDFGSRRVLKGASLAVNPGELVALIGANGSGKSTLLRILGGHLLPVTGDIRLDGASVLGATPEELARLGLSLASGSRPVFPDLNVRQNLRVAAALISGKSRRREAMLAAVDRLGVLAAAGNRPAGTLSGGEQRLLAISQSLMAMPRVLLADEVTLGLSPDTRRRGLDMLRGAADEGAAVLVVEHELADVAPLADRLLLLEHGRIDVADRPPEGEVGTGPARFIGVPR